MVRVLFLMSVLFVPLFGDHLMVCLKRGDQEGVGYSGIKNGMIVDYISSRDSSYGADWWPSEGAQQVFVWMKLPYSYKGDIDYLLASNGLSIGSKSYRQRLGRLVLDSLPLDLRTKWNKYEKVGVIDLTGPSVRRIYGRDTTVYKVASSRAAGWIKSTTVLNSALRDLNSIASGSTNIGSGETYTTLVQFGADIATMTGDLTGTLTSATSSTAVAVFSVDMGGHTLTITSDTDHLGDPTAGNIITANIGGNASTIANTSITNGSFVVEKLNINRVAGTTPPEIEINCGASVNVTISDIILSGIYRGIWFRDATSTVNCYNVKVFNCSNFGIASAYGVSTIENVTAYNCGLGFDLNSAASTLVNCVAINSGTADYGNISAATLTNCAWSGTGAIGGGTETGTVDGVADADFVSVTSTDNTFLDIDTSSSLYNVGADGTISGHAAGINGVSWVSGAWDIGAFAVSRASVNRGRGVFRGLRFLRDTFLRPVFSVK